MNIPDGFSHAHSNSEVLSPDVHTHSDERPIAVLDSGLGGLRVLDRLMRTLPNERFVYLGDTLHMPYGEKTQAHVAARVSDCLQWLCGTHRIKMVVVACNTAASVAPHLFSDYADMPFVDPVTPICRWLKTANPYAPCGHIGVMATPATVASNRYQQLLDEFQVTTPLTQVGCGGLATLIESGEGQSAEGLQLLEQYLCPLIEAKVKAIILGCTHYPYLMDTIAELASGIEILDPAVFMTAEADRLLTSHRRHAASTGRTVAEVDYFVTAEPDRFYETGMRMPFQALAMKQPTLVLVPTALATPR